MRPVDARGNPQPWFTYAAIAALEARVMPGTKVFEYGAGYSTLWWMSRGCRVIACEHDADWARQIESRAPGADIRVRSLEDGTYVNELSKYRDAFDIVVIDGRQRAACAALAPAALNGRGVVVFDNSDEAEHVGGLSFLAAQGFERLDFAGFGPINGYPWMTSILYRDDNCLNL